MNAAGGDESPLSAALLMLKNTVLLFFVESYGGAPIHKVVLVLIRLLCLFFSAYL